MFIWNNGRSRGVIAGEHRDARLAVRDQLPDLLGRRFDRSGLLGFGAPVRSDAHHGGRHRDRRRWHYILVAQSAVPELRVRHFLTQRRQTPAVRRAHDKWAVAVILPRSRFNEHYYLEL
jgi:hypothetical protein